MRKIYNSPQDQNDTLDLTNNDIKRLENFPNMRRLKTLLISNNDIQKIERGLNQYLPHLETLIMNNNKISDLNELSGIFDFAKSLKYLSLLDNPVTNRDKYRLYVIHHLPLLRMLDFEKVKQKASSLLSDVLLCVNLMIQERIAAAKLFDGQEGKLALKELSKTFEVGQLGTAGKASKTKEMSAEKVASIKNAIAKAQTLEEVVRLEKSLPHQ